MVAGIALEQIDAAPGVDNLFETFRHSEDGTSFSEHVTERRLGDGHSALPIAGKRCAGSRTLHLKSERKINFKLPLYKKPFDRHYRGQ